MHEDNRQLSQPYQDCIAACWSCAQICNECSDDMIGMDPKGHDDGLMARCIRMCRECAEICALSAQWMSRLSPLSEEMCRFCAHICDVCAELCDRHAQHHPLCGRCADECRRCAAACRDMAAAKVA